MAKAASVAFRIELKLAPTETGRKELEQYPNGEFTPDFAVAASGFVQIEIGGQLVTEINRELKLVAPNTKITGATAWLPDYLGGFAHNLARAAKLLYDGKDKSRANFVDEPLSLLFKRHHHDIEVIVQFDGAVVTEVKLSSAEFWTEINRSLQAFRQQLLAINPQLANHLDVKIIAVNFVPLLILVQYFPYFLTKRGSRKRLL